MKVNVYLDDLRDCPKGFTLAKNIDELKDLIAAHEITILSLDHDLGTDAYGQLLPTGYDFVK
ncbi:MAG: cyclic-phosphate processing receiver domain-containing protein [Solibacillus sp.]